MFQRQHPTVRLAGSDTHIVAGPWNEGGGGRGGLGGLGGLGGDLLTKHPTNMFDDKSVQMKDDSVM